MFPKKKFFEKDNFLEFRHFPKLKFSRMLLNIPELPKSSTFFQELSRACLSVREEFQNIPEYFRKFQSFIENMPHKNH